MIKVTEFIRIDMLSVKDSPFFLTHLVLYNIKIKHFIYVKGKKRILQIYIIVLNLNRTFGIRNKHKCQVWKYNIHFWFKTYIFLTFLTGLSISRKRKRQHFQSSLLMKHCCSSGLADAGTFFFNLTPLWSLSRGSWDFNCMYLSIFRLK